MKKLLPLAILVITPGLSFHVEAKPPVTTLAADTRDFAALKSAAEQGDARAQLEYGKTLTAKSRDQARVWIQKAADQGLAEAWFWLGYAGVGTENDLFYYEKAAQKGYPDAFRYVLDGLLFRARTRANVARAKQFADLARQQNIEFAAEMLETVDRCYEAGAPHVPPADRPPLDRRKVFRAADTDCADILTGAAGAAEDWSRYRHCLLSQDDVDNNSLAELYANGWGVKRNAKLAIALVCHGSDVPAELAGMVDTLYSTRDQDRLQRPFTFCDHATSGMSGGYCAARRAAVVEKASDAEIAHIVANWTEPQKRAFRILRTAANDYYSSRATLEQDMSGTARAQIAIAEETAQRNAFLNTIKTLESGLLPKGADLRSADAALNQMYVKVMSPRHLLDHGTVTQAGIRATQRKWLRYRDAWVAFAKLRYPGTAPDVWMTWLSEQRTEQLKAFTAAGG